MPKSARQLLLVEESEKPERAFALALASALPSAGLLSCISTESNLNNGSMSPGLIVLDCKHVETVQLLRSWLMRHELLAQIDTPIVLCVPSPSMRDRAQAIEQGISMVLDSDGPALDLAKHCADAWEQAADDRVKRCVAEVRIHISDMLSRVRDGGRPDPVSVNAITQTLIKVVVEEGLRRWIAIAGIVEDPACRHCFLIVGVMVSFLNIMGVDRDRTLSMTEGALLHDVGKTRLPEGLLYKPGPLTPVERAVMRLHPILGYDLLAQQDGFNDLVLDVARHHHEHIDGSGYPDGLSGSQISDDVRLATICDIFAALIEPRIYKEALLPSEAIDMMKAMGGSIDLDMLGVFEANIMPLLLPNRLPRTSFDARCSI